MLAHNLTELNYRNSNGIEVSLLWDRQDGQTWISVADSGEDSEIMFPVSGENAADAFLHPYAYIAAGTETLAAVAA